MRRRRWIRRSSFALAGLALAAALAFVAGAIPPLGPIGGGRLRGETAPLPTDWSIADRVAEVQVETHLGGLPWSVTTWCLTHEGTLYLPARNCLSKRWVKNAIADPNVRVRLDGRIYELRAERDEDPAVARALLEQMLVKYLGIEAEVPTLAADGTPEEAGHAYVCAFRMEPRR